MLNDVEQIMLPRRIERRTRAHKMVLGIAKEMANECYEACASKSNDWYTRWPVRRNYIRQALPYFFVQARGQLARMLRMPGIPEDRKQEIAEALILDAQFTVEPAQRADLLKKFGGNHG